MLTEHAGEDRHLNSATILALNTIGRLERRISALEHAQRAADTRMILYGIAGGLVGGLLVGFLRRRTGRG